MFIKLVKWLLCLAVIAGAVYVAVYVPIGEKTLWQHLRAIAGSKESKDLVKEVKQKVNRVLHVDAGLQSKEQDNITNKERQDLRKVIRDKIKSDAR